MSSFKRGLLTALLLAASAGNAQSVPSVSLPSIGVPGVGGIGRTGSSVGSIGGSGNAGTGGLAGTLGGTVNDLVNGAGSFGTGGLTSGVTLRPGGQTQMIAGRLVNRSIQNLEITRAEIERELESNLNQLEYSLWAHQVPAATLLDLRKLRLAQLVKDSGGKLEMDGAGNPAVRGRLIAIDPTRASLKAARRAGFTVIASERDPFLGSSTYVLGTPRGITTTAAMQLLRRASPKLTLEFDHVFEPAGGALAASSVALASSMTSLSAGGRPLIGMIDGGVGQSPALAAAQIEQKGFAGSPEATGHGTAIASLIVGSNGKFRGAAPNAVLLVGDVYGGDPASGSALAVAKAMSWLASRRPSVINISLVGPRNLLVERAVVAAQRRGIKIVAAVGNDGPAAPALYPASQPGVIAVTGVCEKNRALPEAGRSLHLDYAGPGANMAAALPGGGYANVRGTSYAAPFVSARLALAGTTLRLDAEALTKGYGRIGRGIVCATCRVSPKRVGAR